MTPLKSLASALRVLGEFVTEREPLGVVEIADRLGLLKGNVSKVLSTFKDAGFLIQDPQTKKYSVGLNAFALGNNFVNANQLSRDALPIMRKLVDSTDHSAVLSVLNGADTIHLLAVEGRRFIDGRWRVGRWLPYHATSAGKILLAFGAPDQVDFLLNTRGLPRITQNTITEPSKFRAALRKAAKVGYAVSRSEAYPESAAIAVPLFAKGHQAIAALGLICPEHLLTADEEQRMISPLQQAARELSYRLGAEIYPFGP